MPISTRVVHLDVLGPGPRFASPESDELRVRVELEDGRRFEIAVATFDRIESKLSESRQGFLADPRVLFVSRADQETVAEALVALAEDMSGYWLRRYNVAGSQARLRRAAKGDGVSRVELSRTKSAKGAAVIEAFLEDSRQFSILAAEPKWLRKELERSGVKYYFGAPVLLLEALDEELAREAVGAIARAGDAELCLYDAPRTDLPQVLAQFKSKRAAA